MSRAMSRGAAAAALAAGLLGLPRSSCAQAGPCGSDLYKFCSGVQPGGGRLLRCLKEHGADLSPECARAVGLQNDADREYAMVHGGVQRIFIVHYPLGRRPASRAPAVLVLHGGGGTARGMVEMSGFNETADENGVVAVYPEGTGPVFRGKKFATWNAGRCCAQAMVQGIDDVGFLSGLIDKLVAEFSVDPDRVYATGISNGSQMSFRLACEASGKIAGIAPVASQGVFDGCAPSRPVPILYFHGTADPCAPYAGGKGGDCFQRALGMGRARHEAAWSVEPAPQYMEQWARRNRLSAESKVTYQRNSASCRTWGDGSPAEVVFCTIRGMGHVWPGGGYGPVCRNPDSPFCRTYSQTVGPLDDDVRANDMMWEFFKRHPKR